MPLDNLGRVLSQQRGINDSEHLVAFASVGTWLSGGNESRRDSITPPTLSSTSVHSVLDAMASLCVRLGKREVYAVGL